MVEGRTGIPETQTPRSTVIDFETARQKRLSEPRQAVAAQHQTETPYRERGQEPNVAASTATMPLSVPAEQNHLPHEPKDTLIDLEAVRRKLREEQGKRQRTGTDSEQNAASDPKVWEIQERDADLPLGKMKVVLDKYTHALIDTPEEKARKRAKIPQDERQRLTEVVHAYGTSVLCQKGLPLRHERFA